MDVDRPGQEFVEGRVHARGVGLRYWEAGAGPAVVFVHGSTGPEPSLGKDILARSCRVVELEQPGFGNAVDDPATTSYADLADTIAEAFLALGLASYHLVGTSLGGITSLNLAVRHPQRVRSLVLEASMGLLGDAFLRPTTQDWAFLRAFVEDPDAPAPPIAPHPRKPWEHTEHLRDQFRRRLRVVQQDRYYVEGFDEALAAAAARTIAVPATVLYGTEDPFVSKGMLDHVANNYRKALPKARFVVIDGAGHDIQGEAPELFAEQVLDTMARADAATN
jgi:pimeloyl-ACP methyl ester carboxylesterase